MVNEDLKVWIKKKIQQGYSAEEISTELIQNKYPPEIAKQSVNEVYTLEVSESNIPQKSEIQSSTNIVEPVKEKANSNLNDKPKKKNILLFVIVFIILVAIVVGFVMYSRLTSTKVDLFGSNATESGEGECETDEDCGGIFNHQSCIIPLIGSSYCEEILETWMPTEPNNPVGDRTIELGLNGLSTYFVFPSTAPNIEKDYIFSLKEITTFLNIKISIRSENNGELIIPLEMGVERDVDLNEDGTYNDITLEYISIHSSFNDSEVKDLVKIKVRKFPGDECTTDDECDDEDSSTDDICGRSPYKRCLHIPK